MSAAAGQKLAIHPLPEEETPSADYRMTVAGEAVPVQQARVSACLMNQVWPGYQRPLNQTEIAAFASWEMVGEAEVVVESSRPVSEVRVRPRSAAIEAQVKGKSIRFTVPGPGQYVVEVNDHHCALHLFVNPPEEKAPEGPGAQVRYFGPGVHCPGVIELKSGQTLYLAGGAVVYGVVRAENAENIVIRGRGILDGSKFDRMDADALLTLGLCRNVKIEGITLRDPSGWTLLAAACRNVDIRNLKIIGNWRYNSDGIDLVNCQDCTIEDSFIRSFDDSIALKGYYKWGRFIYELMTFENRWDGVFTRDGKTCDTFHNFQHSHGKFLCDAAPIKNIQVRRCLIWNEWGRALEIGAETVADEIAHLLFEDCDIIHVGHVALDVQNLDRAHCHDIVFRNIRVELDSNVGPEMMQSHRDEVYSAPPGARNNPHLIVLENKTGYCIYDDVRGRIDDILFENIEVTAGRVVPSRFIGYDKDHPVQDVTVKNLRIDGKIKKNSEDAGFHLNEFAREIAFE